MLRRLLLLAMITCCAFSSALAADWEISSPVQYQIVQRQGYNPRQAHEHAVGGAQLGFAEVQIVWKMPAGATAEARTILHDGCTGKALDWAALPSKAAGDAHTALLRIPAGGWYRLELRAKDTDKPAAVVEAFGVGELFVVAGQSYACGHNDELQKVTDPAKRVAAFDVKKGTWQIADDPQPNLAPFGTIWPAMGDHLAPIARVPVGFVNVAIGATTVQQWQPGELCYPGIETAGTKLGRFRAVLWQQGESDVIAKTPTDVYMAKLVNTRKSLAKTWGFSPAWVLAKSTLHPTVYKEPEMEEQIRKGLEDITKQEHFNRGPDTDVLANENRGGVGTQRHFSGIGQKRAALMWFASIWNLLDQVDASGELPQK